MPFDHDRFALSRLQVDRDRAEPLYRQLARAIRYRVFTGALSPGAALPPVRDAESLWGVHHHTVRRAYQELAQEGLVESRRGVGTHVLSPRPSSVTLQAHLRRFLAEAEELFGADVDQVARLLEAQRAPAQPRPPLPVWVVECSVSLSIELADQLARRWGVDARGWPLDRIDSVPEGPVLTSHFHARQVRGALEARNAVRVVEGVGVQLDPVRVAALLRKAGPVRRLVLCERDPDSAHGIADDLRRLAGPEVEIVVVVPDDPNEALELGASDSPVVFSHGSWDGLDHERVHEPWVHRLPVRFNPTEDPVLRDLAAQVDPS